MISSNTYIHILHIMCFVLLYNTIFIWCRFPAFSIIPNSMVLLVKIIHNKTYIKRVISYLSFHPSAQLKKTFTEKLNLKITLFIIIAIELLFFKWTSLNIIKIFWMFSQFIWMQCNEFENNWEISKESTS